jgi:hypothetical protein
MSNYYKATFNPIYVLEYPNRTIKIYKINKHNVYFDVYAEYELNNENEYQTVCVSRDLEWLGASHWVDKKPYLKNKSKKYNGDNKSVRGKSMNKIKWINYINSQEESVWIWEVDGEPRVMRGLSYTPYIGHLLDDNDELVENEVEAGNPIEEDIQPVVMPREENP